MVISLLTDFRRTESRVYTVQAVVALLTLLCVLFAVAVNELCAGVNYSTIPLAEEKVCLKTRKSILQALQSICTVISVLLIVYRMFLARKLQREHELFLSQKLADDIQHEQEFVKASVLSWGNALELIVNCLHVFPGTSGSVAFYVNSKKLFYSVESLLCVVTLLRLYELLLLLLMLLYKLTLSQVGTN
ncbi:hypothetical protein GUITHDRAFT_117426 [Guillardia theta CCMP2712]|uniref:Uncharacterized protein n=1 Tax=Guillardia theta (strain CCMP2712) TaxID=905079 RepID=L1IJK0_GUITC|nr:hypothetical protein GUITHDRAFT_117426 [Guillardia theta CCMP2712]EKX36428.1 hypothetical protein GUITHDRAFT_117426 [Guillardia theta CCMP2712]|eukprot:XP_005823408.1 hypothetical protein GUITHDRAFT_117426 [Guillardia theta CCMP2712]